MRRLTTSIALDLVVENKTDLRLVIGPIKLLLAEVQKIDALQDDTFQELLMESVEKFVLRDSHMVQFVDKMIQSLDKNGEVKQAIRIQINDYFIEAISTVLLALTKNKARENSLKVSSNEIGARESPTQREQGQKTVYFPNSTENMEIYYIARILFQLMNESRTIKNTKP